MVVLMGDDRDDEDVNLGSDEGKYAGDGTDTEEYSQGLFDALWAYSSVIHKRLTRSKSKLLM